MIGHSVLERLRAAAPEMRLLAPPRGRQGLHVMPTTAGCEVQTGPRYSWDGRKRGAKPFTVLQHTVSGSGWLRYEGEKIRVLPGQTFVVTVPHDHRYWVEEAGRWEFFWISMNGQEALRVHRNAIAAHGPILRLAPATIEHLAACCLKIVEADAPSPGAASLLAYEALMALHDGVAGAPAQDLGGRFGRALAKIREPLTPKPKVAALAAAAGLTRAHFSRTFAAEHGEPPARFARAERLKRAAALLAGDARATVKQAAAVAGFKDVSHFAKAFRAGYGAPPGAYRGRKG